MTKRILFLCTANSCRSQMAEGIAKQLGGAFEIYSAGSMATGVNPTTIDIMREIGIDISQQHSKAVGEFAGQDFDYVITLCASAARDICPTFPGTAKRMLHWNLPDPVQARGSEEERLAAFRKVRDEIRERIEELFRREKEALSQQVRHPVDD